MPAEKYFNISRPCNSTKHYMLPAQERCKGLLKLIDREQYFIIHAARQSGKTTLLLDLTAEINKAGNTSGETTAKCGANVINTKRLPPTWYYKPSYNESSMVVGQSVEN